MNEMAIIILLVVAIASAIAGMLVAAGAQLLAKKYHLKVSSSHVLLNLKQLELLFILRNASKQHEEVKAIYQKYLACLSATFFSILGLIIALI